MTFDLKNLAFLIFIWAVLNIVNGVIITSHDFLGGTLGTLYYPVNGVVRLLIGLDSMILFLYLWYTADDIVIFTRQNKE
jgi:hypothetical protein